MGILDVVEFTRIIPVQKIHVYQKFLAKVNNPGISQNLSNLMMGLHQKIGIKMDLYKVKKLSHNKTEIYTNIVPNLINLTVQPKMAMNKETTQALVNITVQLLCVLEYSVLINTPSTYSVSL